MSANSEQLAFCQPIVSNWLHALIALQYRPCSTVPAVPPLQYRPCSTVPEVPSLLPFLKS